MEKYAAARRAWEEAEEATLRELALIDARIAARRARAVEPKQEEPKQDAKRQASSSH